MKFDQQNLRFRKTQQIRQYLSTGAGILFSGGWNPTGRRHTISVLNDRRELIQRAVKTTAASDVIDLTAAEDFQTLFQDTGLTALKNRSLRIILPIGSGNFQEKIDFIRSNELLSGTKVSLAFELGPVIAQLKGQTRFVQSLSEFLKVLQGNIPNAEFLIRLDGSNCIWADDCLWAFEELGIKRFFFTLDEAFIKNAAVEKKLQKEAFHILMFLESLQRHRGIGYAERKVYKRLANLVQTRYLAIVKKTAVVNSETREDACIFLAPDLLIQATAREIINEGKKLISGKFNSAKTVPVVPVGRENPSQARNPNPKSWKKVLITGWYGTETQGDKAILGELLYFIKQCSPQCEILLTTIHQIISEQTNTELEDLKDAKLVNIKEASAPEVIRGVNAVIIGGGPLTDSTSMREIWKIFAEANRQEKARIIFGCGIGPLHLQEYTDWTKKILELTTAGFLRDMESKEKADRLCPSNPLNVACDPALAFVNRWQAKNKSEITEEQGRKKVGTLLRAMTGEFFKDMTPGKIAAYNVKAGKEMAECLSALPGKKQVDLLLLHMNAPWIGGDDRLFNRYIEFAVDEDFQTQNIREYLTLDEHLKKMTGLSFSLAMRYHGHIFSLALGIPFLSIDYTGKQGKVSNLLKRIEYEDLTFKPEDLNSDEFLRKWNLLLTGEEDLKQRLRRNSQALVSRLYEVYRETFEVEIYPFEAKPNQ